MGWLPMPVEHWPETAELLTSTGRPWPEGAAITDLRWHVDQRRALPGRVELQRRWNWPEWSVRSLLRSPSAWWDPTKGAPPESRAELESRVLVSRRRASPPGDLPETSRTPTGDLPVTNGAPSLSAVPSPNRLPEPSKTPPGDLHARGCRSPSPSPSPPPEEGEQGPAARPPPQLEPVTEPVTPLAALVEEAARLRGLAPMQLGGRCVAALRRMVDELTVEDLQAIERWRQESGAFQAVKARQDRWAWGTILSRERAHERLAEARAWVASQGSAATAAVEREPEVIAPVAPPELARSWDQVLERVHQRLGGRNTEVEVAFAGSVRVAHDTVWFRDPWLAELASTPNVVAALSAAMALERDRGVRFVHGSWPPGDAR